MQTSGDPTPQIEMLMSMWVGRLVVPFSRVSLLYLVRIKSFKLSTESNIGTQEVQVQEGRARASDPGAWLGGTNDLAMDEHNLCAASRGVLVLVGGDKIAETDYFGIWRCRRERANAWR
jgi:hypothetical protein